MLDQAQKKADAQGEVQGNVRAKAPDMPQRRLRLPMARFIEPRVLVGGGFLAFLAIVAIAAPWIAPKDPLEQDLLSALLPPAGLSGADPSFLFGTDDLGRDVLSRLIYGARTALFVALVAASLAGVIGSALGLLAGWYRGSVDLLISRMVDIWMAFPPVLLSILLVAVLGSGVHSVIAAIVIIDWTRFCRVVRAETMSQGARDYVTAAQTVGFARFTILRREILPNVMPVIITLLSIEMGIAVIVEAILSFVGLSVSSDVPTWGGMIAQGRQVLHEAWWVFAAPLAALFATVLAFNLLGDGLQRALDPVRQK